MTEVQWRFEVQGFWAWMKETFGKKELKGFLKSKNMK